MPTVDANTNRFNPNQGYAYDKAGNITNDPTAGGGREFTFNGDNKQTEVRDSSITPPQSNPDANLIGRYHYDGEGKRVKKVTATEITVFVYSAGKLVAEYSTELPQNPTTSYIATDTLQSVRAISDKNGNIISRRDFMPFGEELYANTANRTTGAKYSAAGDDGIRQKFTGYEKDKETNLDFAEARYYNNAHGRFTAVDPLLASGKSANPQTFNRYAYTMNRPTLLTDPSGLCTGINCPANYYGTVYTNGKRYSNVQYEGWTVFKGDAEIVRDDASGLRTFINEFGWYEAPEPSNVQRLLNGFPANPWEQAATGTAKGVGNFFISVANTATFLANNNRRMIPTFDNPFAIERYSLNTPIERNFGYGTEGAMMFAGPVAAAPFRAGSALSVVPESTSVIVDSNVIPRLAKNPSLNGLIQNGETPVASYISRPELRNAVSTGSLRGVPKSLNGLDVLNTRPSLNLRINIRGSLPAGRGNFGDGIIGAQAIENKLPLITADQNFANVVRSFGGNVRVFKP